MVWVMAQWLEVQSPNDRQAAVSRAMHIRGLRTSAAGKTSVHNSNPAAAKLLRTRVGV